MGLLLGVLFALAANQISPRGLSLTRNYFPVALAVSPATPAARAVAPASPVSLIGPTSPTSPAPAMGDPVVRESSASATNQSPAEMLAAQIKTRGLHLAVSNQVVAWFNDPRRHTQKVVFLDARNEEEFQKGHVPGAWLFDPYYPDKYFAAILPVCQAAEQIVVYCHGGDCDDSLTAASLLLDVGIPGAKIAIYGGGMTEWPATGLPVETGAPSHTPSDKAAP